MEILRCYLLLPIVIDVRYLPAKTWAMPERE